MRQLSISLDPMAMIQLATGVVSELHLVYHLRIEGVRYEDCELVVRATTTFRGYQETIDEVRRYIEGSYPYTIGEN